MYTSGGQTMGSRRYVAVGEGEEMATSKGSALPLANVVHRGLLTTASARSAILHKHRGNHSAALFP